MGRPHRRKQAVSFGFVLRASIAHKCIEQWTPNRAFIREIKEEFNTEIAVDSIELSDVPFDMDVFICHIDKGQLQIEEGTHMGKQFTPVNKLRQEDWSLADSVIVEKIIREGFR